MKKTIGLLLLAAFLPLHAQDDILTKAMRDELDRSMKQLQLENMEKPYFIAYRVLESNRKTISATFGTLTGSSEYRLRYLNVELHVGDYKLDNTNFFSPGSGGTGVARMYGGTVQLPIENDYRELRRQIWLATDGAYKKALEDLSKKRAALQNKTRTEEIPDLTREQAATSLDEAPPIQIGAPGMEALVREMSALFKEMPDVFDSRVQLGLSNTQIRYLNSEGTSYRRLRPSVSIVVRASTQAPDGMPLEDYAAFFGNSIGDLPGRDQLAARIRELGANLKALRAANPIEQYNGPVLFEGSAAAELFSQAFAPNLVGTRRPISDNPSYERYAAQAENPFVDKLGARVLPEFLNVTDNATASEYQKTRLAGWYKADDDGIAARETRLVEKGYLKTLLTSRNPVRGVTQSTGNRRGAGAIPSNLFVVADNGLNAQELRQRLIGLVKQRGKEYGIVVRSMGNPSFRLSRSSMAAMMSGSAGETRVEPAVLAYKVFPDGKEELIRNAEISGLSAATFKEILAASKEQVVYTVPFRGRSLPGVSFVALDESSSLVSFVMPSLLFEDLTLKKPSGEVPKPPVAKHPFFDK
jgi:hypothetical protein